MLMPSTPALLTSLELPDQTGRTWLITGATSGIGRELALAVMRAGGHVIAPARNPDRAASLVADSRGLGGRVETPALDLSDLASVRRFAESLSEDVDVLVNNAGLVTPRRRQTADGFEMVLGTNFLGPFALTNLVAHRVRERIVITGSGVHKSGRVDVVDPHFRERRWNPAAAYGQSKLCDMLWARALQHRLDERASSVKVTLAHPGWAATGIQNVTGSRVMDRITALVTQPFSQPAAYGALPLAEAAVGDHAPLSYLGPDGFNQWRGEPEVQQPAPRALDDRAAQDVWELGVRETGTDLR